MQHGEGGGGEPVGRGRAEEVYLRRQPWTLVYLRSPPLVRSAPDPGSAPARSSSSTMLVNSQTEAAGRPADTTPVNRLCDPASTQTSLPVALWVLVPTPPAARLGDRWCSPGDGLRGRGDRPCGCHMTLWDGVDFLWDVW
ncbi:hypothetical protein AAFF_G00031860 [Aldrovandia affinis]|uniref:Uncharacterized protein n=1 Tax=Aldrovandia affinis TaxID=143900 RepID=A0AAD7S460_9TELE|nr:hypothetical protein AAFF_G00031860 [Aldrovandia affinis]